MASGRSGGMSGIAGVLEGRRPLSCGSKVLRDLRASSFNDRSATIGTARDSLPGRHQVLHARNLRAQQRGRQPAKAVENGAAVGLDNAKGHPLGVSKATFVTSLVQIV